ncbi:MgtC/SapB family protein [Chenggangzhangella methanolivorans]|uniref:Protein MgtC n=1 Tax=Chenggangzhangella methanolivorans TaxID=1437009 RepID=A0A9E6RA94_9HYPH|nr:MgtC/SapB family protein [Chenggangzhangella methanolivorans]QZO01073.1 MgtC/SapB family protein [Chenggangzhangella methanolivorans]
MTNAELVMRLGAAAVAGGVVGVERERLQWAAGLRTHMMVCVGACLAMIVSAYGFDDIRATGQVSFDPSRVAAQVISGVSFLGAGTILLRGEVVRGLTTAASIWGVAAIGLAIGGGLYVAGTAATLIIVGILAGVKPLEERYRDSMKSRALTFVAPRGALTIDKLNELAGPRASRVRTFVARPAEEDGQDEIVITFVRLSQTSVDEIAAKVAALPEVKTSKRAIED